MPGPTSIAIRNQIIGMSRMGASNRIIAANCQVSVRTVQRIKNLWRTQQNVVPKKSPGPPLKTTPRQDRVLLRLAQRHRRLSAMSLKERWGAVINIQISRQTVNSRLLKHGYRARRTAIVPRRTQQHLHARLAWAQRHRNIHVQQWRHVIFTDESSFQLHRVDRRMRVRRLRGERLNEDCLQGRMAHGGGSVHVWGGIHYGGKTDLIVLIGNVNGMAYRNVIQTTLLPHARRVYGNNVLLQDDNAPAHRARVVENFLQTQGVDRLPWPALSPDMNPIEHAWDYIDRAIRRMDNPPTNLAQLSNALVNVWNNMPIANVNTLIDSMPRRVAALENARGGATRY